MLSPTILCSHQQSWPDFGNKLSYACAEASQHSASFMVSASDTAIRIVDVTSGNSGNQTSTDPRPRLSSFMHSLSSISWRSDGRAFPSGLLSTRTAPVDGTCVDMIAHMKQQRYDQTPPYHILARLTIPEHTLPHQTVPCENLPPSPTVSALTVQDPSPPGFVTNPHKIAHACDCICPFWGWRWGE